MVRFPASMASLAAALALLVVLVTASCTEAYAFGPTLNRRVRAVRKSGPGVHTRRHDDGSDVTLYLFPTPPSVSAATSQPLRHARHHRPSRPTITSTSLRRKSSLPAMSSSVLSPSDTLPSFHTAHGLLSPEVVMRIADAYTEDLEMDGPLHKFLKMYKRRGPMACLPMLSDGEILPELTRAMREIV